MAGTQPKKTFDDLMAELYANANPDNVAGMARFGITPTTPILGLSIYTLRAIGKGQCDHEIALRLWETGLHEARLLACFMDDPAQVTPDQMDRWAADFDTWDLCDQATTSLFDLSPYAVDKALEWADREEEFVRRGGYALMAGLAWHRKDLPDEVLLGFLPVIEKHANDPRNFVKKAVNWALRNIGKRAPAVSPAWLALAASRPPAAPAPAGSRPMPSASWKNIPTKRKRVICRICGVLARAHHKSYKYLLPEIHGPHLPHPGI